MKKNIIPALAAALLLTGWQASADTPAPEIRYGAKPNSIGEAAKAKKEAAKAKKEAAKDKKEKKEKKADKDKKDKKADKKDKKSKKNKEEEAKEPDTPMANYLKDVTFFNAEPNLGAEYFIYLQSASWCGPCNAEMPHVVDTYKAMKEDGRVEIILVGHDRTEDKAKGFLTQYKAEFPGILATDPKVQGLPGFSKANGIPNAIIVNAQGEVMYKGHPGPVFNGGRWKSYTIEKAQ